MRKPSGYNELKTERLLLRTPLIGDAAIVNKFGNGEFRSDRDARNWIRGVHRSIGRKTLYMFYIWLAQTGQHLGRVYIYSKPEIDYEFEVAYGIYEEHRCKGYATEAARAAIQFVFEQGGPEMLVAIVKPENIPSQRVIAKLGFTRCGTRMVPDENGVNCEFDYFKLYKKDQ
ncbi:MAG: GNAT family N-acetyltransferase [Oscillospiraceae bacterium]|nr:GNAT family N-acetyltransferase [Oscillospiraceae bacterium]